MKKSETIIKQKLYIAELEEALRFYEHWEKISANAYSKTYMRTDLTVSYPGPSKATIALDSKIRSFGLS